MAAERTRQTIDALSKIDRFTMQNGFPDIADFFQIYAQAAWDKDINSMAGLYDDGVMIFDMWGDKACVSGLKEWSLNITGWLTSLTNENVKVSFDEVEIEKGDLVAFATALVRYQAIANDGTILRGMRNRITVGFVKNGNSWKAKHQHTSVPVDGELRGNLTL